MIDDFTFWHWAKTIFSVEEIQQIKSGNPARRFYQYSFANLSVSAFLILQGAAMTIKFLPMDIPTVDKLGISQISTNISKYSDGLILITGVTGSGKTTTLTSIVNDINQRNVKNIFILEEGITYLYPKSKSLIYHWEIGTHIPNFEQGVLTAIENHADIIVINEIKDRSTFDMALRAAKRGVLVIASMHSSDVISTIQELLTFYSSQEQDFIHLNLANHLQAIVSQRLVTTLDAEYKRTAIFDLLFTNEQVRNYILAGKIQDLSTLMQAGKEDGMSTMKSELESLLTSGRIKVDKS
ncbi:MAG: Flp pilus assembly complex ATPase component [Sphaerospermopsis sp. SIO1G2]|nr:Flp pilus assembly complex ATPase component [Sphaerospermopsis sp. SIO1G2]